MKRIALILSCLLAFPAALAAFDRTAKPVSTVGVLMTRPAHSWAPDESLARAVEARLVAELREHGFDAVQTRSTWEDERESDEVKFDVLVEITSATQRHENLGGVVVGGHAGTADVSVVHSHASAIVNVYDGRTLEPIEASASIERSATGVVPTGIALGDRHFGIWIPLPFARYARQRALAQAIAEEAASQVAIALRTERAE